MAAAALLQIKNFAWSNQERRWFNPFVPLTKAEHRSLYLNSQWLSVPGCRQNSHESGVQDWPLFPVKSYYVCFCVLLPAFKKKEAENHQNYTHEIGFTEICCGIQNRISWELLNWGYTPTTLISYEGNVCLIFFDAWKVFVSDTGAMPFWGRCTWKSHEHEWRAVPWRIVQNSSWGTAWWQCLVVWVALVLLPGKAKMNAYLIQGRDDPMPLRQPLTKFEDRTKSCQGRQMSTVAYYKETLKVFLITCLTYLWHLTWEPTNFLPLWKYAKYAARFVSLLKMGQENCHVWKICTVKCDPPCRDQKFTPSDSSNPWAVLSKSFKYPFVRIKQDLFQGRKQSIGRWRFPFSGNPSGFRSRWTLFPVHILLI